jgi:hypothetical protein
MYTAIFILLTFSHNLGMASYFGGGGDKRTHKNITYSEKGD